MRRSDFDPSRQLRTFFVTAKLRFIYKLSSHFNSQLKSVYASVITIVYSKKQPLCSQNNHGVFIIAFGVFYQLCLSKQRKAGMIKEKLFPQNCILSAALSRIKP